MSNLKVHFAGAEQFIEFVPSQRISCVNYSLMTAFPFISQALGIKPFGIFYHKHLNGDVRICPKIVSKYSKHCILDSGLFTLMFGAHAAKRTKKEIEIYFNALIQFIKECVPANNFSCVEIDCQKILGVNEAWEFRKKMRDSLKSYDIMNVWHLDDGMYGLERLVEFSDYICISIPELRIHMKSDKIPVFTKILCEKIKNKKPSSRIHLLGCTQKNILTVCKDIADTSDSTAWQKAFRFGGKGLVKKISNYGRGSEPLEWLDSYIPDELSFFREFKPAKRCISRWALSMIYHRNLYQKLIGDQS